MWENILIRDNFAFSPEINATAGSYALKHSIEFVIGGYVANGELIAAMILEGFEFKQDGKTPSLT